MLWLWNLLFIYLIMLNVFMLNTAVLFIFVNFQYLFMVLFW